VPEVGVSAAVETYAALIAAELRSLVSVLFE
jgi:hypothetical protein